MQNVTTTELVGLFEDVLINDEKVENQKSTIKMINADSKKKFDDFAKDKEMSVKDVKAAYKYYKQRKNSTDDKDSEDFFTLVTLVDMAADNERREREGNE